MYRRLFYSVYRARNRAVEACVSPTKCDVPALTVFRVANGGVKALSTSPINYCEKKDSLPPKQDGKSSTSMEGKVDSSENKVTEMSQQVAVVGVVKSEAASTIQQMGDISTKSKETASEERLEVRLEEGKEGLGVVEVGVVQTEADNTIQQMDIISTPEVEKSKESSSEERLEVRLEEGKEGLGVVEVGVVQAEADNTIQHVDDIGTLKVQKSKESSSEERLEVRLEEDKEGEGMLEVGVVQTEADNTIQQMDIIRTPEVEKSKESSSEERLEVLEEGKEGLGVVEVGVIQAEADNTIQHVDDIGTPEVQKSIESSSEERLEVIEVRLEEVKEGEVMMEVGVVQAEADNTIQHVDDIGTPEVQKSKESSSEERLEVIEVRLEEDKEGEVMMEVGVVQAEADNTIQQMDDIGMPEVQKSKESTSEERLEVRLAEDKEGEGMVELKNAERTECETSSDSPKSSKASLLDLLGAMKVDVTSKRKFKSMKVLQSSTPTPKPAAMESTESMFQKATEEASVQSDTLNPELVAAASAAAATLPNQSQAESELLRQLRKHEAVADAQKKGEVNNLGVIIADMKVGKGPNRQKARPSNQIRFDDDGRGYVQDRGITAELDGVRRRRTLFSGKRLGIFSPTVDKEAETAVARPTLWDIDFTNQIVLSTNQSPRNALEEMVQWTKEGKLWEYPINNEAGLEEEMSVPFHEHIFLDKHLVEGFPQQGPVRHFMELVVAGLASNAHLTVQQKKDHISWFRDYFHQKEDVLKEAEVYLN